MPIRLGLSFLVLLLSCATLWGDSRLVFPRVLFQKDRFPALAIVNPASSPADVTLRAYNSDGTLFAGNAVTNPRLVTIPAGQQYARGMFEIFTPPESVREGANPTRLWMEASSPTDGLTGFFLDLESAVQFMDGSDLSGNGSDVVLPLVENTAGSAMEISLVNPDPTAASVNLDFFRSNGTVIASQSASIPALGALQGPLSTLFPISYDEVVGLRVRADRQVLLYGYIFRQAGNSSVTIAAQNRALPAKDLYFPQLAEGAGWATSIGLVNFTTSQVQAEIFAYQKDGTLFSAPAVQKNPVAATVLAGGIFRSDLKSLFGFDPATYSEGWIKVQASTAALNGYVEYGQGPNRALVPAQLESQDRSIFSHQALESPYFTGLAVLNTGTQAANVEVVSMKADSTVLGKAQRVLQPGQREVGIIQQWVPTASGLEGSVFVKSDKPTVATQLFGHSSQALANVPPQEVTTAFDPSASLPSIKVFPPLAIVETGKTQQFSSQGASGGVSWLVNSIPGGDSSLGTVTPSGLYKAPAVVPGAQTITLQAASSAQSSGAAIDVVQRETLTSGLSLVTAVAYLENLQRFFVAEQQILSSVVVEQSAPRATTSNAKISEQTPGGAVSTFLTINNETIGKMLSFVDGNQESYLLIAGTDSGKIYRLRIADKNLVTVHSGLNKPNSMTLDPASGDLLVSEQGSSQITTIPNSAFDPTAGSSVVIRPRGFQSERITTAAAPQGVAVDECSGALYVTTSDGFLREYLGDQVRVVAAGLNNPTEILVMYRDGTSCEDGFTLLVCEANRVVQVFPQTGEVLVFSSDLDGAVDLDFFSEGSPFTSNGDDAVGIAEGPAGPTLSRVSVVRVRKLYRKFGPLRLTLIPRTGVRLPYRDPVEDNFGANVAKSPLEAAATSSKAAVNPQTGLVVPDILAVNAAKIAEAVVLSIYFRDPIAPFNKNLPNSIRGFIDFDLGPGGIASHADRLNPFRLTTGIGVDVFIDLSTGLLHKVATNETVPVPLYYLRNILVVRFPTSVIKISPSLMTIVVGNRDEFTDVAPNIRFIIVDVDSVVARTLQFARAVSGGLESTSPASVEVNLSAASPQIVTVNYAVVGGSAQGGGVDYTLAGGTLSFAPGETSKFIRIELTRDNQQEPDETILLALSSPGGAALGTPSSHLFVVRDAAPSTPAVSFATAASSGTESTTPANLAVVLSSPSSSVVTVNYGVSGGTAEGGSDYTLAAGSLVFNSGETTKNIGMVINDDALDEPDETIEVSLVSASGATLGATRKHTYTIRDNDPPRVQFEAGASSGLESAAEASVPVVLSSSHDVPVTINYSVTGGSASGGTDYTLTPGTLTFNPGETKKAITFTVVDDAVAEADETVELSLGSPVNATLGTPRTHSYTITDNDGVPRVAFSATASSGSESATPANLAVMLSNPSSQTVTVDYAVSGGTATNGADYVLASGKLSFNAGETSKNIGLAISEDNIDEFDETVIVALSSPAGAILGTITSHTFTIVDNDAAPTTSFATASSSGSESVTPANLTLSLSNPSEKGATVNYAATGGTAAAGGVDYTLAAGALTFSGPQTSKTIPLTITNDASDEPDETVIVSLTSATEATIGSNATHTYTIQDNDPPVVQFNGIASSGSEATTPATLAVVLSNPDSADVTVNYAVTGGTATNAGDTRAPFNDYTLANGVLTFKPGETSKDISIAIVEDAIDEFDQTIVVMLSSPTNATLGLRTSHTYTILDNDAEPTITFTSASSSGSESMKGPSLGLALSAISEKTISVNYAATGGTATNKGVDYDLPNGTLSFPSYTTSNSIFFSVVEDSVDEPDETAIVVLSGLTNAQPGKILSHTYTILDNDPPRVSFTAAASSGSEPVRSINLAVTLSNPDAAPVSVKYAASTAGTANGPWDKLNTDHDLPDVDQTLTFASGQTSMNISFIVSDDVRDEPNETVIVNLSAPINATLGTFSSHTYTIIDDDAPPTVSFSASSVTSGSEGSASVPAPGIIVTLSATSDLSPTVSYSRTGGTATAGADFNFTPGALTFGPSIQSLTIPSANFVILQDSLDEPVFCFFLPCGETVVIGLSSPTSRFENAETVNISVVLTGVSSQTVSVNYVRTGGTATTADYSFTPGTLSWAPGTSGTKIFSVTIVEDSFIEADETIIFGFNSLVNCALGSITSHTYTIRNDDVILAPLGDSAQLSLQPLSNPDAATAIADRRRKDSDR